MHFGHLRQISRIRELLGEDCAVVCVMSGNFVQRGDFAVARKHVRAAAAVAGGADLVVELPLLWAVASAERFARGGVQALGATGLVTHLAFGSECADGAALQKTARALLSEDFPPLLKEELARKDSFAAARQRAAGRLLPQEETACLSRPNDLLAVEYCKALFQERSAMEPLAIVRTGAQHDAPASAGDLSAGAIRRLLADGRREEALERMAPAMARLFAEETAAGRAPVRMENCERAMLARLRSMDAAEFAALDGGGEGLGNRLYAACRTAPSLEAALTGAKTKRYAYARLRRMALWAYLGLAAADFSGDVPYLRLLAAGVRGRELLARMRGTASLPVVTKPADVRRLGPEAQRVFALEARAADLYALAYPELDAALGGGEWRQGPVIL